MRCEPLIGERYELQYDDPTFGSARAIASKNLFDVQQCDMTLAYLPRELENRRPSYGTVCELAWAHLLRKPVILVTDDLALVRHPLISACAGWLLRDLDEAIEVVLGLLLTYERKPT